MSSFNNLQVTNIYPLFLKMYKDMNKGIFIDKYFNNYAKSKGEAYIDYYERLNKGLISFIKDVYELNCNNNESHKVLKKYENCTIELIRHNNYNLIFFKSPLSLIFLNYVNQNVLITNSIYIPKDIPRADCHIVEIISNKKIYTTINTFDAFVPFGKLNGIDVNLSLNGPFFSRFAHSVIDKMLEYGGIFQICCDINKHCNKFDYYRIDNIIIISKYYETKEDDAPVLFEFSDDNNDNEDDIDDDDMDYEDYSSGCAFCGEPCAPGDMLCPECANNID